MCNIKRKDITFKVENNLAKAFYLHHKVAINIGDNKRISKDVKDYLHERLETLVKIRGGE